MSSRDLSFKKDGHDPDVALASFLKFVKALSLTKSNAVWEIRSFGQRFFEDPLFSGRSYQWLADETQNSALLVKWVEQADPGFNFANAMERFREKLKHPVEPLFRTEERWSEYILRQCLIKTGTACLYKALSDKTQDPLLKAIAEQIARCELQHYDFLCDYFRHSVRRHPLAVWKRAWLAIRHINDYPGEDLAVAYFAANTPQESIYHDMFYQRASATRLLRYYNQNHIRRTARLIVKATGVRKYSLFFETLQQSIRWLMTYKAGKIGL